MVDIKSKQFLAGQRLTLAILMRQKRCFFHKYCRSELDHRKAGVFPTLIQSWCFSLLFFRPVFNMCLCVNKPVFATLRDFYGVIWRVILEMRVMSGKHWLLSFGGRKNKKKHISSAALSKLSFPATGSLVAFETQTKTSPPLHPTPPTLMSIIGSWFCGNEKVGPAQWCIIIAGNKNGVTEGRKGGWGGVKTKKRLQLLEHTKKRDTAILKIQWR